MIIIVLLSSLLANKNTSSELGRKIVHIGTGPIVPIAYWLNISQKVAIIFSSLITLGLIINYQTNWFNQLENIDRKSYGTIAYGLSITLLITFFWSTDPSAVCAGVLVMSFGDGFAGLVGKAIPSPTWKIFNQQKSLIGTLTMGLITLIVLIIINFIQGGDIKGEVMLLISMVAMGLEQIGPYGIDNFTVPIGTALIWNWLTYRSIL